MVQKILIKRNVTAPLNPPALDPGELGYNGPVGGPHNLFVGDGTGTVQALVAPTRQVELAGAQTIAGVKTFDDVAKLKLPAVGAVAGQVLTTDGPAGNLTFTTLPAGAVPAVPASAAEIAAGVINDKFATPLNLDGITGELVSTLTTTAKTLVPAINELKTAVDGLAQESQYVGSFLGTTGVIDWTTQSGMALNAPLPAAGAANAGWQLIATAAGTDPTGLPAGDYQVGDWLLSDGAAWNHLAFGGITQVTASQVGVSPAVAGATDVQAALVAIDADNAAQDTALDGKINVPATAPVDLNIAVWDGVTGSLLKDGTMSLADLVDSIDNRGDVYGPASVTLDSNIAIFDNTSGKILKDSTTTILALQTSAQNYVDQENAAQDLIIDGKVTGPVASIADRVATFSDLTGKVIKDSGTLITALGDVKGPAAALADQIAAFDGTTGKLIKATTVLAANVGDVKGPALSANLNLAVFSGITGKLIADGGVAVAGLATKTYVDTENGDQDTVIATKLSAVLTDTISIVGNGAAVALSVALVDGGTY